MSRVAGWIIELLAGYCGQFLVEFSSEKTEALHFFNPHEKVQDFPIMLGDSVTLSTLDPEEKFKILGFHIDNKLSWSRHIEK